MTAMAYASAWPAAGRPITVADLDLMPDDGRRYELLDGALIVTPRPTTVHQLAAGRLTTALSNACPDDLLVVPEPAVQLTERTEFAPDLVVVRREHVGGAKFAAPPLLVIEIRSPSTALIDLNRKFAAYQRFGVGSYWLFDPDPGKPELTVYELRDGTYQQAGHAAGATPLRVERPFAVVLIPADCTLG